MTGHLRRGRVQSKADEKLAALNVSLGVDKRLFRQDIAGSIAHARMLAACGLLTGAQAKAIISGLKRVEKEIAAGAFVFRPEHEDIHMNIEARLGELITPELAGRLHTARSRNDQIALDLRLYLRSFAARLDKAFAALLLACARQGERHAADLMPGFTHLQTGQPVTFGHHCLAYAEMFARDRARFAAARTRMDAHCPLGAGALAGSALPIDPAMTAKELGFAAPLANSLDAVSDRDFVLEFLAAAALTGVHLSRLGEEIVLWASPAFGFIRLSDKYATTSSMLPQKRNPDGAELLRAASGKMTGALVDCLTMMKGLPLAYAKDMQQDKQAVFGALDLLLPALELAQGMIDDMAVQREAMAKAAASGHSGAADLADWLVQTKGWSFRAAHSAVGQLVRFAEGQGKDLSDCALEEMQTIIPPLTQDAVKTLDPARQLKRRSKGGPRPAYVRRAARQLADRLTRESKTGGKT